VKDRIKMSCVVVALTALIFIAADSLSYAQPKGNPPGPRGGPGAGPRRDLDNNPPGRAGGPGTNWENPPGPRGGPGTGANRGPAGNPPGPRGGPGTNWENPPGPQGGAGATPDNLKEKAVVDEEWEKMADTNQDGVVDRFEAQQWRRRRAGMGDNPPGSAGGEGTDWENPPGPRGGPGAGANRGPAGNPPGPRGGPGAGPRGGGRR